MKITPIFFAIYLTGAFLTGGYYWNHRAEPNSPEYPHSAETASVYAGAFFPIYWAARGAILITK